jgi:TonB family protein
VFFGNLADLLQAPFRRQIPLQLASQPAPFWPDVFVPRRLPLASFRWSALYHLFLVMVLWSFSHAYVAGARVQARDPFANSHLVYYPISEYLPAINENSEPPLPTQQAKSGPARNRDPKARVERKGELAYAKQQIVSRPHQPDNTAQTIITPPNLPIQREIQLPNIVAWTKTPAVTLTPVIHVAAPVPAAAVPAPEIARAQLTLPPLAAAIPVAPPPAASLARSQLPAFPTASPVAPPPNITAAPTLPLPALPVPSAVEPPPANHDVRRPSELNLAKLEPQVAVPHPPEPEHRAMRIKSGSLARANSGQQNSAEMPAAPQFPVSGSSHAMNQIVALGLHPVPPIGPIAIPEGKRHGEFAAGPEGKADASGVPEIRGGSSAEHQPKNHSLGTGSGERGDSALEGILVAAGPVNPGPMAAAGPAAVSAAMPAKVVPPASRKTLLATLKNPAELARQTRPGGGESTPKIEDAVFGAKKYYSMMLNLPNFTSTGGGSWIIRFAELKENAGPGELTAPVPMVKVDPAYSPELQQEVREGVVILYAVIHSDGQVGEVRVLRGVDRRLDTNACAALMHWRFRPGTKNGSPVALEAVVQIPFKIAPVE